MILNDKFIIKKTIYETTNNVIFKATDAVKGNIVALKVLKSSEPDAINTFRKDYHILQTLIHPNIVKVLSVDSCKVKGKKYPCFVMEFIDGLPFNYYFKKNGFKKFVSLFLDILHVLSFVHEKGLLHCDLKPQNILITKEGAVKLVDFGFAQLQENIIKKRIGGTLQYIAPEILKGERPDIRTEIYTLGLILYESLAGNAAISNKSAKTTINAIFHKPLLPLPFNRNVPNHINTIVMKMADKLRVNRYSNIKTIIDAIENKGKTSFEKRYIEKLLFSDFIGRKENLQNSDKLLKKASEGNGQIFFIEGITGIGKTRLLKELEHRLFLEGKEVHYIKSAHSEKQGFDWLMNLIERISTNHPTAARIFAKEECDLSGEVKYHFFDKAEKALKELSHNATQILVIDDIDFKNKNIHEFFLYISNFVASNKIMIIGATERVSEDFEKIVRHGDYENIHLLRLQGLDSNEIVHFVKNLLGVSENAEKLAQYLYEKTEGNPYFIEEILKELLEKKLLKRSGNGLVYHMSKLKSIKIPRKIDTFVHKRLQQLTDAERTLLRISATFGRSIPIAWLIKLSPFSEAETLYICEKLYLTQFFTAFDNYYDFTHILLREIICKDMQRREKKSIHKRIVELLENQKQTQLILKQKAFHSFHAGMHEADTFLLKTLKHAIKSRDIDTAMNAFGKLQQISDKSLLGKIDIDSIIIIGNYFTHQGNHKAASKLFSQLLSTISNKSKKIKLLHSLAVIKTISGKYNEAGNIFENLIKITQQTDRKFEVLIDTGWLCFCRGNYIKAEKTYNKAMQLSSKLTKKVLLSRLLCHIGILKQYTGQFQEAQAYGKKSLKISQEFHSTFYANAALNLLVRVEQYSKGYAKAIPFLEKTLKHLGKTRDLVRTLDVLLSLVKSLYYSGKIEVCEEKISEALNTAKKLGKLYEIAYLYNLSGNVQIRKGNLDYAEKLFTKAEQIGKSLNNAILQFCTIMDLALVYVFRGERSKLAKIFKQASNVRKNISDTKELLKIDLVRGIDRFVSEDYEKALLHFGSIEQSKKSFSIPEYQTYALIYKGLSLMPIGNKKDARIALKQAKESVQRHGMLLFKGEIDLLEIAISKETISASREKRIEKWKGDPHLKTQRFLYARILLALSDIMQMAYSKQKESKYFIENLAMLKEAKSIFLEMKAAPFISRINKKLIKLVDGFTLFAETEPESSKYLETLDELGKAIQNISDLNKLKERFLSLAKKITGAERGLFLMLNPDTDDFIVTGKHIDKTTIKDAKRISRSALEQVKTTKKPIISHDARTDKHFKKNESVLINEIRSLLCIPIISGDTVLGTLYLDSTEKPGIFSQRDKRFFTSLANLLAGTLIKALDYKKIEEEAIILKTSLRSRFGPKNIIGKSAVMQTVFDRINNAAKTDIAVLIHGETGTGKELVAGTIHLLSDRKEKVFSIFDCLAIPPSLLESELFGYIKGAFTGAEKEKIGLLEASQGGTILIDEIGDASGALQASLLRFLDTGGIKKIGATKYKKVRTRIIAATNKNIRQLV
ncbi:MAG: tetratricopeptide repeat protein, partial [Candidatus Cloacimonadota bacterium]